MSIAYKPLGNGVPQRPFRPQAQAADTTVSTGLIRYTSGMKTLSDDIRRQWTLVFELNNIAGKERRGGYYPPEKEEKSRHASIHGGI